jgi:uncharacterized protein (DUF305 family)
MGGTRSHESHTGASSLAALHRRGGVRAGCGCGGDDIGGIDHGSGADTQSTAASGSSSETFNDADVTFAKNMIAHYQQAVELADLAATRAANAQAKVLATQINPAQQPETDKVTGWLNASGKPTVPAGGHGGHSMPE